MKKLALLIFLIFSCAAFAQKNAAKNAKGAKNAKTASAQSAKSAQSEIKDMKGTFKDFRDKKQYKTIKLGGRVWMAEDLNYKNNKGKLYDFEGLKDACPAGWRLPSAGAWEDLKKDLSAADPKLKALIGWPSQGKWWAVSSIGADTVVYYAAINSGFKGMNKISDVAAASFSVRCIQNIKAKPSEKKNDIRLYKTAKIGNQVWMAENLNYKTGNSWCYGNDDYNCNAYGRLYDWGAAEKACPAGWHLPTRREWGELAQSAELLDSASGISIMLGGQLTGEFSHAVPASEYKFLNKDLSGNWWGAPEYGGGDAYSWHIKSGEKEIIEKVSNKSLGFSVRCVQNIQSKSAKANDIKQYKTAKIGNQVWMAENLNYKTGKSWCFEDDDFYCGKYGRLYDWSSAKKACPAGWHLPSDSEWNELQKAAGKNIAKEISALQGGWRDNGAHEFTVEKQRNGDKEGRWHDLGETGAWWTATLIETIGSAQARQLSSSKDFSSTLKNKSDALSIRCIQDPQARKISRTFTDPRDGKQYGVIMRGKVIWMKDNLGYNAKGSFCYDNKPENCDKYGRLYEMDLAQSVCPAGWRLAGSEDWADLADNSGGKAAGKKLKSKDSWNGSDEYGFAALPGGFTKAQGFSEMGEKGYWWTSDAYGTYGKYSYMSSGKDEVVHAEITKYMGFSVRCVMDCGPFNCVVE